MSGKQTIIIFTTALLGGLVGAAAMLYVGSIDTIAAKMRHVLHLEEPAEGRRPDQPEHRREQSHAQKPKARQDDHDQHKAGEKSHQADEKHGEEHDEEQVVRLSEAERHEFGIEVRTAGPGKLQMHVSLPGEVVLNADRRAHVVPRVPGIVRQVHKKLGDQVRAGEAMAVLESRDLADLQSAYLTATEKITLAEATFRREADLWQKKITSEQEYLEAKQALMEARIERRTAEQKLHAVGFSDKYIAQLPNRPETTLTQYALTAPFDGTVIEKHITLGDVLKDDSEAYVVADLRSVWVDLRVYQKDLPLVRPGQPVVIVAGQGIPETQGTISYVGPLVGEQTRTALARVVLPNPSGHWRPGLFVTGNVVVQDIDVPVVIPKTALQTLEERPTVFVETAEGFIPQPVTLGRSNDTVVELTAGLTPGQRYVTSGAFTLKAQLSKGAFGDGHGH
jgi:membrane fusion protein, heavy metal efflux system